MYRGDDVMICRAVEERLARLAREHEGEMEGKKGLESRVRDLEDQIAMESVDRKELVKKLEKEEEKSKTVSGREGEREGGREGEGRMKREKEKERDREREGMVFSVCSAEGEGDGVGEDGGWGSGLRETGTAAGRTGHQDQQPRHPQQD